MSEENKEYEREMEELVLKESIVSATGLASGNLQIGIKGDPSMRETAMVRQRYRNTMDEIYPDIEPQLEELLHNRSTYRLYVGFNSVEIRTNSIFDRLPDYWRRISERRAQVWQPMECERIAEVMPTLKVLRDMPDYYLRGASICLVQDLLRLQFNCDGTQLVSARNYQRFLEENIPS